MKRVLLASVVMVTIVTQGCQLKVSGDSLIESASVDQEAGERGVPVSAAAPSFMPSHLSGPNAGGKACPLCVHGLAPQLQIWIDESKLAAMGEFLSRVDEEAERTKSFVPYVVLASSNGKSVSTDTLSLVQKSNFKALFFVQIPSWDDPETGGLYGHSSNDKPGVRVYAVINRRVFQRWDNPSVAVLPDVFSSIEKGRKFVTTHHYADAQIAPAWEEGQRMTVKFRILDSQGRPIAKAKVNAYQTNIQGRYNPKGWNRMLPSLATTAWADSEGLITFDTVMPGHYPTDDEPAHIHFSTVIEGKTHFRTLWFEGDKLLTSDRRKWADNDEETVIVKIDKRSSPWVVEHTFRIRATTQ